MTTRTFPTPSNLRILLGTKLNHYSSLCSWVKTHHYSISWRSFRHRSNVFFEEWLTRSVPWGARNGQFLLIQAAKFWQICFFNTSRSLPYKQHPRTWVTCRFWICDSTGTMSPQTIFVLLAKESMAPTRVSIEVSNYDYGYIISKLVYDLFLGLTTYLHGRYNPFTK